MTPFFSSPPPTGTRLGSVLPACTEALLRLMGEHCRGNYGFNMSREGMKLNDSLACGSLPAGAVVTSIAGHDVLRAGHRVWDAIHERCGTEATIPVTFRAAGASGEIATIDLICANPASARPQYLKVISRPGTVE